jgi:hypothetical protein
MSSATVEIHNWSVEPIHSGGGEGLGVYRFAGNGKDRGQPVWWSLILKEIGAPAEGGYEDNWNYWKRETIAYGSGLLEDLPGGLGAPRCFKVEELADGTMRLWLEDLSASNDTPWSVDRYALAARHLGQFNGAGLAGHRLHARAEQLFGRPMEEALEMWAAEAKYIATLTDEAHQLAHTLHP